MMKKLFYCLVLLLSCFIMSACGGPSVKEEAQRLDTEYYQPGLALFNNLIDDSHKLGDKFEDKRFDESITKLITENYKPKFVELQNKLKTEKNLDETKLLHEQLNYMAEDVIKLLDVSLEITKLPMNTPKDKATPYINKATILINNLISEQAEYKNQYSILTTGKSTYELSLRNYQQIQKGDSYASVVKIFKMPGTLTNSSESNSALIGHRKLDHYVWKNGDAYVRIMFENGKVYMMEQKGLK